MDALSPLVSGGTNIGLTNPYSLYVPMIGRQDHFKSTLKQRVQQTPKRSSLGPVPNLSITHNSCADRGAQPDIGETGQAAPHHDVPRRRIIGAREVSA